MKHFDTSSLIVIAITLILFSIALFATGFTHDLLLEAGVFLVSVKLIQMTYKNGVNNEITNAKLNEICRDIKMLNKTYQHDK